MGHMSKRERDGKGGEKEGEDRRGTEGTPYALPTLRVCWCPCK